MKVTTTPLAYRAFFSAEVEFEPGEHADFVGKKRSGPYGKPVMRGIRIRPLRAVINWKWDKGYRDDSEYQWTVTVKLHGVRIVTSGAEGARMELAKYDLGTMEPEEEARFDALKASLAKLTRPAYDLTLTEVPR